LSTTSTNKPEQVNWFIPILSCVTFLIIGSSISSMPVLFKEISQDLNLNIVQLGSVWGMISFGSIFMNPVGGILCDRLGTKRAIIIIGLASGLSCALVGLSSGFLSLLAFVFLWGLLSSAIMPALNIIVFQYSPREKQGLAQGLLSAGGGLGFTLGALTGASVLSPWLGGWRDVFYFYGGLYILIIIVWQLGVKKSESTCSREAMPFHRVFTYLLRQKAVWLVGLCMLVYGGCVTGMQGFLAYHLESVGWSTIAAGGALSVFAAAGTIGCIPLSILSDRIGSRKIPLLIAFLTAIICIGLLSVVHSGILWVLMIMTGIPFFMAGALFTTLVLENKEIGAAYTGTAIGIMGAIVSIGKAFVPPIGNSLANISTTIVWPFIFWAVFGIAGIVFLFFIRETGWHSRTRRISER
jgi:predicted MFS family arabinose efflux permease